MGLVLEKPTVAQFFKKFASFHEVPAFVAVVPRSSNGPNLEFLNPSLHFFKIHYNVTLHICAQVFQLAFSFGFPHKNVECIYYLPVVVFVVVVVVVVIVAGSLEAEVIFTDSSVHTRPLHHNLHK